MSDKIISLIKMDFLTKNDSYKNWRMIFFISFLTLIMISSGHSSDNKVFKISDLNHEIRALKSEFVIHIPHVLLVFQRLHSDRGRGPGTPRCLGYRA